MKKAYFLAILIKKSSKKEKLDIKKYPVYYSLLSLLSIGLISGNITTSRILSLLVSS